MALQINFMNNDLQGFSWNKRIFEKWQSSIFVKQLGTSNSFAVSLQIFVALADLSVVDEDIPVDTENYAKETLIAAFAIAQKSLIYDPGFGSIKIVGNKLVSVFPKVSPYIFIQYAKSFVHHCHSISLSNLPLVKMTTTVGEVLNCFHLLWTNGDR